ncbi:hypothetical protein KCP73_05695 [Salmonella enterica subsp. enterica]|nr:hypothetical protein KCP73_05695 [Salmonella enterica subsp. enterica]
MLAECHAAQTKRGTPEDLYFLTCCIVDDLPCYTRHSSSIAGAKRGLRQPKPYFRLQMPAASAPVPRGLLPAFLCGIKKLEDRITYSTGLRWAISTVYAASAHNGVFQRVTSVSCAAISRINVARPAA